MAALYEALGLHVNYNHNNRSAEVWSVPAFIYM
jgi:hypothetical protein